MDRDHVEQVAREFMGYQRAIATREPGWTFHHGLRVAKIALEIATLLGEGLDMDVLFVGGLFHDVGKGEEQHNVRGAELAGQLLAPHCTEREMSGVCEIVELHNQRKYSKDHSAPVRIVQDADLVDHVGPVTPWLAIYWSGAHGECMQDHVNYILGEENRRYRTGMRNHLSFDVSVRMFEERVRWEDDFFATLRKTYSDGVWHDDGADSVQVSHVPETHC